MFALSLALALAAQAPDPAYAPPQPPPCRRVGDVPSLTIARDVAYPPLSDALRARLADFYADDVERLSRMIGRPLDHWLTPRRAAA